MQAVTRERLPGGSGYLQELHTQAENARKIPIEGDDGQIALQAFHEMEVLETVSMNADLQV